MTGTDPAVDAARRAWETYGWPPARFDTADTATYSPKAVPIEAAREALAPIREVHKPFDRRTMPFRPAEDPHDVVCNHCLGPVRWPCATALYAYTSEELTND